MHGRGPGVGRGLELDQTWKFSNMREVCAAAADRQMSSIKGACYSSWHLIHTWLESSMVGPREGIGGGGGGMLRMMYGGTRMQKSTGRYW